MHMKSITIVHLVTLSMAALFLAASYRADTQDRAKNPLEVKGATVIQNKELASSLTLLADRQTFELRLQNVSDDPIVVLRWDPMYEIRLFDSTGRKLSHLPRYFTDDVAGPGELCWTPLRPHDSICFELTAFSAKGPMAVPDNAYNADCL